MRAHLPELVPTWERLVELCGHDETAARMLTLWNVPAFQAGCSQAVLPGTEPVLVRNYDCNSKLKVLGGPGGQSDNALRHPTELFRQLDETLHLSRLGGDQVHRLCSFAAAPWAFAECSEER